MNAARPAGNPNTTLAFVLFAGSILIGVAVAAYGAFAWLPIFGLMFIVLVVTHPEYGIALFLSTFLMTYPEALQGSGLLTVNNVLGAIFLILLTFKVYQENNFWFLSLRDMQLLVFILVIFFLSDRLNGPDPRLRALLGVVEHGAENMRTILTRTAFILFFINFIRSPRHVTMIYVVAVAFMVTSSISGVYGALHGGGFAGYRAQATTVIAAAWNPNREAMFSILAIAELYYITTWLKIPGIKLMVAPVIGIMCLCVFLTASRSGLLGLVVCAITIVIDEGFSMKAILGVAMTGALVTVLVLQVTPERTLERITNLPFTQGGEEGLGSGSLERRAYTWEVASELFRENPILGVGVGNWDLARFLKDPTHSIGAPHSSYFLALCEGGIFCLAAYLLLLWRCWRNIRYVERCVDDPDTNFGDLRWIVKSTKTDFVVLVFFSAFADLWQLVILYWLVGIGIVLRRMFEQGESQAVLE